MVTVHERKTEVQAVTIPVTEQAGGKWPAVLKGERVAGTADDVFLKRVVEGGLVFQKRRGWWRVGGRHCLRRRGAVVDVFKCGGLRGVLPVGD